MITNKTSAIIVWAMIAGFAHELCAGEGNGGQAGAFLRLGAGARAAAMGNAYTGIAEEVSAVYWNPAGLGFLERRQFLGMYSSLSLERQHSFIAYAQPNLFNGFSLGAGWLHFGVGEIDGRDVSGNPSGKFENSENAFLLAAGYQRGFVAVGATAKYLRHSLAEASASGFSFDAGLQLRFFNELLSIGFVAQDIRGELKWNTPAQTLAELPGLLRGGVAIKPPSFPVVLSGELVRLNGELDWRAGGEYRILKALGVRAGYSNEELTLGGFIAVPTSAFHAQLDYAFGNEVFDEGAVHRVALLVEF